MGRIKIQRFNIIIRDQLKYDETEVINDLNMKWIFAHF